MFSNIPRKSLFFFKWAYLRLMRLLRHPRDLYATVLLRFSVANGRKGSVMPSKETNIYTLTRIMKSESGFPLVMKKYETSESGQLNINLRFRKVLNCPKVFWIVVAFSVWSNIMNVTADVIIYCSIFLCHLLCKITWGFAVYTGTPPFKNTSRTMSKKVYGPNWFWEWKCLIL